jgi:hypothetical protein
MSVAGWRDAAAQRTAAERSFRRLAGWLVILPVLGFFSFTVVAGAAVAGKPDYAAAARALPAGKPLVLVEAPEPKDESFLDRLTKAYEGHELCAVTPGQLAVIGRKYSVGHMTIDVGGAAVDIATVTGSGANDHELRTLLGDPKLRCKLVRMSGTFFLPFDAHTS